MFSEVRKVHQIITLKFLYWVSPETWRIHLECRCMHVFCILRKGPKNVWHYIKCTVCFAVLHSFFAVAPQHYTSIDTYI